MMVGDLPGVVVGEPCGGAAAVSRRERELQATRVLIVDDHADTVEAMQMLLVRSGYEIRAAYSGAEAISVVREFSPALAILDIRLPDINGYDLALLLRAAAGDLRLIALSSASAPDHTLAARFDEIARKPISGAELRRLLRRFTPR